MFTSPSLRPPTRALANIILRYREGKPLTSEEIRFLSRYHNKLSHAGFDPILDYFKVAYKKKSVTPHLSFLLPEPHFSADILAQFKARLASSLDHTPTTSSVISMSQYQEFKSLASKELHFWHGNQYLSKAHFFGGGLPHVELFQWGNLFGIAKYVLIPGEINMQSEVLLQFQQMKGLTFESHVIEYLHSKVAEAPDFSPTETYRPSLIDNVGGLVVDSFQLSLHPHPD